MNHLRALAPVLLVSLAACGRTDLLGEGLPLGAPDDADAADAARTDAATTNDAANDAADAAADGDAAVDWRRACLADHRKLVLLEEPSAPLVTEGDSIRVNFGTLADGLPGFVEASSADQWRVYFSSSELERSLKPGVFTADGSSTSARMEIVRYAEGETYRIGEFEVIELAVIPTDDTRLGPEIASMTIAFRVDSPRAVRGCLHIAHAPYGAN